MKVFYITIVLTFTISFIARVCSKRSKELSSKPNIIIVLFLMFILISVAGLRYGIGDTGAYKHTYNLIASGKEVGGYEPGFLAFVTFLTKISKDPQFMVFVTAFITTGLNILTLRKYSSLFELQTYMYITAGYYLATMNGIRQALVASILFSSVKFIIEGKFKIYLFIVLLMSTFHTSALIMIPVYFIVRNEAWSKKMIRIMLLTSICFIFFEPVMNIVFKLLEGSRYGGYEDNIREGAEGGVNIIRVIVAAVPVILSYLGRDKIIEKWKDSSVFINLSIINLIIMVFALINWIFSRFTFYFQLYNFVLLPYLINTVFDRKSKPLIYFLFIVFYFIYFYYDQVICMGIQYRSDFINF